MLEPRAMIRSLPYDLNTSSARAISIAARSCIALLLAYR
jgi:hypothetical protein